ncbi:protein NONRESPONDING TO OXYLIPINS 2, mitochondrial [Ziziphus jujuba]|uniref:Protein NONRESPONDING TO OXYLIPINS 2, mitochondrial n=2 Tax=Ziziphus jujuba TaxID=326968 RepID=A0A6P4BGR3_ZIZJJ|nr:protein NONRESPONDING TO OXYLIPINS 2, mitochondrial [Ziziphus jujuba]KAH7511935.1 hypothetical protein FEM48_Zijuj12G0036500 [Ziziphus jujuba var. spinosa]
MASSSSKLVSRLSSRLRSFTAKPSKISMAAQPSPLKFSSSSQTSVSSRRIPRVSRLPLELSSMGSMMPLHSAVASARLISSLSIVSGSWGLVPQGISMPL